MSMVLVMMNRHDRVPNVDLTSSTPSIVLHVLLIPKKDCCMPLDSLHRETPCIFNHPNLGTLACCFPTQPIWNLGFFQSCIMKNDNFH
jgi:hypothetical protein